MTRFGQLVVGPPGSGKTTYCRGMHEILGSLRRNPVIVNLDPANDQLPYDVDINVFDLISLTDVMEAYGLGPNGGLMYCMEYLSENLDWLDEQIRRFDGRYFLFDCPGQVELFTHNTAFLRVVKHLEKEHDFRMAAVHLVDAHHCGDAAKFIAVTLMSLSVMMRLELPHVNVLSKIDLLELYGPLSFGLDFYTELMDLPRLLEVLPSPGNSRSAGTEEPTPSGDGTSEAAPAGDPSVPFLRRFRALHERLVELVDDFSLVGFLTLNIQDKDSVVNVIKHVDKANGYAFGALGEHEDEDSSQFVASSMDRETMADRRKVEEQFLATAGAAWDGDAQADV